MAVEVTCTLNDQKKSWRVGGGKSIKEACEHIQRLYPDAKNVKGEEQVDSVAVTVNLVDAKPTVEADRKAKKGE